MKHHQIQLPPRLHHHFGIHLRLGSSGSGCGWMLGWWCGRGELLHPSFSWLFFSHEHFLVHERRWRDSSFRQFYRELQQRHQTSRVVGGGHYFKSPAVIVILAMASRCAVHRKNPQCLRGVLDCQIGNRRKSAAIYRGSWV